jgi:hypothetical protein
MRQARRPSTAGESPDTKVKIMALALMTDRRGILCGKENGSVSIYDINSGGQTNHLYSHKDAVQSL